MANVRALVVVVIALLAAGLPGAATEPPAGTEAAARGEVTNLPLPRFVSMRSETANARRGPSLNHRIDWTFRHRGLPLEVTAEYGQWRRVRDAEGAGGWVHHSLLSGQRTVLVQAPEPVALRSDGRETAVIRAFAEPGVIARLEGCGADWCEVSAEGVSGWAPRATFWGIGPEETPD